MRTLRFTVPGQPQPQGSKTAFSRNGRTVLVESAKNLKPWRSSVSNLAALAAKENNFVMADKTEPVEVQIVFNLERRKSVKRPLPTVKPDIDKLIRATLDGVTQAFNVWFDDGQVISVTAIKQYSTTPSTEVTIRVN